MTRSNEAEPLAAEPGPDRSAADRTAGPFECFGQRFQVVTPDHELAAFIDDLYAPMRTATDDGVVSFRLDPPSPPAGGTLVSSRGLRRNSSLPDRLFSALVWAINRQVIGPTSGEQLVFHAAAAELDGAVVLLPARMEAGKTTLVTGLLDRGCGYLTDEAAVLDLDLYVTGYPKPLSIDPGSWDVLAHHEPDVPASVASYLVNQWQVPVAPFAPVVAKGRLALVVFPRYEPDAALRYEPLTPAAVVARALPCIFAPEGRNAPPEHLRRVADMATRVPVATIVYGDLDDACDHLMAMLRMPRGHVDEA